MSRDDQNCELCGGDNGFHRMSCPTRNQPEVLDRGGYFETRIGGRTMYGPSPDGPWHVDLSFLDESDDVIVDDTATVDNTFGPLESDPLSSYDIVEPTPEALELCALIVHEVNAELCRHANELVLDYTSDIRDSVIAGIRRMIENPLETPEQNHEAWMAYRAAEGWKLGRVKDPVAKTHPCMVPYDMLPPFQQLKDKMFQRIVRTFFGLPGGGE